MSPRKLFGIIPFGGRLRNYFDSYKSAQLHIASILARLADGKDALLKDNAAIDVERQNLWAAMGRLEQMIHVSKALDAKLEAPAPQLQSLDPREPVGLKLRKLMGEELPELIGGYKRVPPGLRRENRNGTSPDRQLVDGLAVVDGELKQMSDQLASGDLDRLATQNRYLALKYKDDGSVA